MAAEWLKNRELTIPDRSEFVEAPEVDQNFVIYKYGEPRYGSIFAADDAYNVKYQRGYMINKSSEQCELLYITNNKMLAVYICRHLQKIEDAAKTRIESIPFDDFRPLLAANAGNGNKIYYIPQQIMAERMQMHRVLGISYIEPTDYLRHLDALHNCIERINQYST